MVNDKADWVAVFRQHFKNKSIYAAQPNKYGNSNMKILGIKNWRLNVALIVFFSLSGCATYPDWLSASGASRQQIEEKRDTGRIEGIRVVDVNDTVARKIAKGKKLGQFADLFPSTASNNYLIGPGDIIEVSIWEAQPAMLFSAPVLASTNTSSTSNSVTLPAQMVVSDGTITIPFAGRVAVKGKTTEKLRPTLSSISKARRTNPRCWFASPRTTPRTSPSLAK